MQPASCDEGQRRTVTPVSPPTLCYHFIGAGLCLSYTLAAPIHPKAGRSRAGKSELSNWDKKKGQELHRTYLVVCIKRKPPVARFRALPRGQDSSPNRHRFFNSSLPRCLRPTRARALKATANRIAPLSANRPIASTSRSTFELAGPRFTFRAEQRGSKFKSTQPHEPHD